MKAQEYTLPEVARKPDLLVQAPRLALPDLLGELKKLEALIWMRLNQPAEEDTTPDRLLTAREASKILGTSQWSLYTHSDRIPFAVRLFGKRQVRFSLKGIQKFMRERQGKS